MISFSCREKNYRQSCWKWIAEQNYRQNFLGKECPKAMIKGKSLKWPEPIFYTQMLEKSWHFYHKGLFLLRSIIKSVSVCQDNLAIFRPFALTGCIFLKTMECSCSGSYDVNKINSCHITAAFFTSIVNGLLSPKPGEDFRLSFEIVSNSLRELNDVIHVFPLCFSAESPTVANFPTSELSGGSQYAPLFEHVDIILFPFFSDLSKE